MFGKAPNNADFTLEDFRKQFAQLAQLDGMKDVMAQMPGIGDLIPRGEDPDVAIRRIQGMMNAMTEEERLAPEIIDENRRRRIAATSGVKPGEIDEFLVQFDQFRTLMRQLAKMSVWQRLKMVTGFGKAGLFGPETEQQMFEGIQRSLSDALKTLRGRGRITEANVRDGLQLVRRSLLDADVNFDVADAFIKRVTEKSVGQEVLRTVDPSEQIVRNMYDELVALMGPVDHRFHFAKDRPTVIMLCGLQGSGKTTTAGKLAMLLRDKHGRKPLLVAADLQRPAAVEQIKVLGEQLGIPVYSEGAATADGKGPKPVDVCHNALAFARTALCDTVILDTAGRLHVAEMPMDELKQIDRICKPDEAFFVCDAMTGQDAVNSAKAFNDALDLNGVILTKLDGDARGGAALSIKEVTKVPIKFVGVGEKLEKLEEFHPERMAQRILGQGDLMGLIEKVSRVQAQLSQEEIEQQQAKLAKGDFTLDDFRKQFAQLAQLGGMKDVMAQMPGMGDLIPEGEDPDVAIRRIQGMVDAMTKAERRNPDIIDLSRRRRIATGSGVEPHEIKQFLGQFDQVRTLMRQMASMSMWQRLKMVSGMGKSGMFQPGAAMSKVKVGTGHRKSAKERAEERKKKRKKR